MNTFIFGLDGADPELVNKWIDQGDLPNLKKIRDSGLSGKLKSTFPPITGPAWTTFQTGVNPGKHGVFNWLDLRDSYKGKVINRKSINTSTVWNHISKQGGKVGVVSLPVTYPPEKVNGFIIPGFFTPKSSGKRSYPKNLAKTLLENVPNYEYLPPSFLPSLSPEKWVKKLKTTLRTRGKAARFLYKRFLSENDSTLMVHFFSTDLVQHKLWDYERNNWKPRLEVFKETDRQIGRLMEMAPDQSTFIVVSDHGFGPIDEFFNVNNWLYKEGYLSFKDNITSLIKKKLSDYGFTKHKLEPIGERLQSLAEKLNLVGESSVDLQENETIMRLFLSQRDVDWDYTKAYSRSDIGHIRVNLKGREKKGIIGKIKYRKFLSELMEKLEGVRLSKGGIRAAKWVKPKEELYKGPFLKDAPDILFNPLPNAILGYGAIMFLSSNLFDQYIQPASHRRDGILLASGPKITSGKRNAKLRDIAPTILNSGSLEIPKQMDGKVIREISPEEPSYYTPGDFYRRRKPAGETDDSRKKLENLGYL